MSGHADGSFLSLLRLRKRESRREESNLVIPNKRRSTQSRAFSGATHRAGSHLSFNYGISRLFGITKLRFICLVKRQMRFLQ